MEAAARFIRSGGYNRRGVRMRLLSTGLHGIALGKPRRLRSSCTSTPGSAPCGPRVEQHEFRRAKERSSSQMRAGSWAATDGDVTLLPAPELRIGRWRRHPGLATPTAGRRGLR